MNKYLAGAIAGTLATVPMTWVMVTLHRRLPRHERYPLPPASITAELADRSGAEEWVEGRNLLGATLAAHFAYGAAVGALYPAVAELARARPLMHHVAAGAAYGVGVWALSYLGWIPALRILPPATQHPPRRNAVMILAHIMWGATLAGLRILARK